MDEISASSEDTATNVMTLPEEAAITSGEIKQCRFCHEEDFVRLLEAPCGCAGTLRVRRHITRNHMTIESNSYIRSFRLLRFDFLSR